MLHLVLLKSKNAWYHGIADNLVLNYRGKSIGMFSIISDMVSEFHSISNECYTTL